MRALIVAAFGAAALLAMSPASAAKADAWGPSFDCRKAKSWVEKTICRDRSLADKDQRMTTAYNSLVDQALEGGGPGTDVSNFRDEQRQWLRDRNRCRTKACIHAAYDKRIGEVTIDSDE